MAGRTGTPPYPVASLPGPRSKAPEPMTASLKRIFSLLTGLSAAALAMPPAAAQSPTADTIIVLDGSGSMWGQIDGRTKIEIARETLSGVLLDVPASMNIGMMVYGHRVRGQCSDIEEVVPVGPAGQTVPRMIDAAAAVNPRGMTPLSAAVRQAAQTMRHTERAATVVLVTDGIETCDADPCALGRELEAAGIDFTAHVVGFGLSGDEGRQVACLAENTGGLYLAADDAEGLNAALRQTVAVDERDFVDDVAQIEPADSDFVDEDPAASPRRVEFILRDTDGGPQLTIRNVQMTVEAAGEGSFEDFELYYEDRPFTAAGTFVPGRYIAYVTREESRKNQIRTRLEFDVEPGDGTQTIERTIAARLRVNTFINAAEPLAPGETVRSGVAGSGGAYYWAYPVVDGAIDEANVITDTSASFDRTLPPGTYLLRGTFARTITREKLVTVNAGATTELDFDFGLTRVYFDVRDAQGFPAARQTTFLTDQPTGTSRSIYFASGSSFSSSGDPGPFFLPRGLWRVNTGAEGGGARRAEVMVRVDGNGGEQRLRLSEGQRLSEQDIAAMSGPERGPGCIARRGTSNAANACLVEEADLSGGSASQSETVDEAATDGPADPNEGNDPLPGQSDEATPSDGAALPPGIYGVLPGADHASLDSQQIARAVNACMLRPYIAYPDGLLVAKTFEAELANAGRSPYRIANHAFCTRGANTLRCDVRAGDIGTGGTGNQIVAAISISDEGHINLAPVDGSTGSLFYACVRPGGEIDVAETLPDGRRAIDHIMARSDGGPELSYADDGTYRGPAEPGAPAVPVATAPAGAPEPGGDFSAVAGLYGFLKPDQGYPLAGDALLDRCYLDGLALFPDGLAQNFRPNFGTQPPAGTIDAVEPIMHMYCRGTADSAKCDAHQGGYPGAGGKPQLIEMTTAAADALRLCQPGEPPDRCRIAQKCENPRQAFAGDLPAPDGSPWFERVLNRNDGGPGLQ